MSFEFRLSCLWRALGSKVLKNFERFEELVMTMMSIFELLQNFKVISLSTERVSGFLIFNICKKIDLNAYRD